MKEDEILNIKSSAQKEYAAKILEQEFQEKYFTDVTLVSEELKVFKAHKCVLSAKSPVMKKILLQNPHPHPSIYLNNINEKDLKYFIQLIYYGTTRFNRDHIENMVKVIQVFQVTGLELEGKTDDNDLANQHETKIETLADDVAINTDKLLKDREEKASVLRDQRDISDNISDPNEVKFETRKFMCSECNKNFADKANLRKHERSKHKGVRYYCDQGIQGI